MFRQLNQFMRRNRRKFFVTAAVAATFFASVALSRNFIIRQHMKYTEQVFIKEQIKRRFQQTQKDCIFTIYELLPVLSICVLGKFEVDDIMGVLKGRKLAKADAKPDDQLSAVSSTTHQTSADVDDNSDARSKAQLWNELKIQSITRMFTVMYTMVGLMILSRLQLNILARREYLESAVKVAVKKHGLHGETKDNSWWSYFFGGEQAALEEQDTKELEKDRTSYINEQAYLSFSWWLLNRGWLELKVIVEEYVRLEFEVMNPRQTLSEEDFMNKLSNIKTSVNERLISSSFKGILLPPANLEQFVIQQTIDQDNLDALSQDSELLRILLGETNSYLSSSATMLVTESLVESNFELIRDKISKHAASKPSKDGGFQLAFFVMKTKDIGNEMVRNGSVNEFVDQLDAVEELDELSASVYSNFEI